MDNLEFDTDAQNSAGFDDEGARTRVQTPVARPTSYLFAMSLDTFLDGADGMMQKTVVVGAGPVGALAALYAAKRGDLVEVYELREGEWRLLSSVLLPSQTRLARCAWREREHAQGRARPQGSRLDLTNITRPTRTDICTAQLYKIHQSRAIRAGDQLVA